MSAFEDKFSREHTLQTQPEALYNNETIITNPV